MLPNVVVTACIRRHGRATENSPRLPFRSDLTAGKRILAPKRERRSNSTDGLNGYDQEYMRKARSPFFSLCASVFGNLDRRILFTET